MITREEYNKALDIIEQYQAQIFTIPPHKSIDLGKTNIVSWDKLSRCSTRLYHSLMSLVEDDNNLSEIFIEDIRKSGFKRIRNAGQKSWTEFTELRGY